MSVFREAIGDGAGSVDSGYLAMFWGLIGWSISGAVMLAIGILGSIRATASEIGPLLQNLGIALGAISGGFATLVGAVGLFRAGDKPHANTVTTSAQQTITTAPDAAPVKP